MSTASKYPKGVNMGRYILKRILWMIPVILGATILIFTIMYFTPGDPALVILGAEATAQQLAEKNAELGLDQPYYIQLGQYLSKVFLHGDLGKSYVYSTSVFKELMIRLPRTLTLGLLCMLLQVFIGIPLGIIAAVNHNKLGDHISMFIALFGVSIPQFWLGLMMVLVFSVGLGVLPAYGIGGIEYFIMPMIANAFAGIASQARQTRSSMLEVIHSDYIVTAKAKGLSRMDVILKHALPNALIPVITVLGNGFAMMLGGAVVIENVFSIPGMGTYMTQAISNRDYPIIEGTVIMLAIAFSIIMLIVDLFYAFIDPRIKAQYERQGKKRRGGKHHGKRSKSYV